MVSKDTYLGLYEGDVEDVRDPYNLGRIRVRIPIIHTPKQGTPGKNRKITKTKELPWALPCFQPGTFSPPSVGDSVWVLFRRGNPDYPVYLGTWYGVLKNKKIKGGQIGDSSPEKPDSTLLGGLSMKSNVSEEVPSSSNASSYYVNPGNESPEESYKLKSTLDPTVKVIASTPKGHTIYTVDDDGKEKLVIVDRFGQTIEMVCPVSGSENKGNKSRRGTKEAAGSGALPVDKAAGGQTYIRIIDANGQFLKLTTSNSGGKKIELNGPDSGFINIEEDGKLITLKSNKNGEISIDDNVVCVSSADAKMTLDNLGIVTIESVVGCRATLDNIGNVIVTNPAGGSISLLVTGDFNIMSAGGAIISSLGPIININ